MGCSEKKSQEEKSQEKVIGKKGTIASTLFIYLFIIAIVTDYVLLQKRRCTDVLR